MAKEATKNEVISPSLLEQEYGCATEFLTSWIWKFLEKLQERGVYVGLSGV